MFKQVAFALALTACGPSIVQPEGRSLSVNTSLDHYVMERSRTDGEQDLRKLCTSANLEEAWFYIRTNEGENWHEVGFDQTKEDGKARIGPLRDLVRNHDHVTQISLYHQHPYTPGTCENVIKSQTPSSLDDVRTAIMLTEMTYNSDYELAAKLDFRLVVTSGVYTMKVNMSKLQDVGGREKAVDILQDMLALRADPRDPLGYQSADPNSYGERNSRFARTFSNDVVKITFTPF